MVFLIKLVFARLSYHRVLLPFPTNKPFVRRCFETIKSPFLIRFSMYFYLSIWVTVSYFIQWVTTPYNHLFWCTNYPRSGKRCSFKLTPVSFWLSRLVIFFNTSLLSGTVGHFGLILCFSYSSPDFSLFSRSSGPF